MRFYYSPDTESFYFINKGVLLAVSSMTRDGVFDTEDAFEPESYLEDEPMSSASTLTYGDVWNEARKALTQ